MRLIGINLGRMNSRVRAVSQLGRSQETAKLTEDFAKILLAPSISRMLDAFLERINRRPELPYRGSLPSNFSSVPARPIDVSVEERERQ